VEYKYSQKLGFGAANSVAVRQVVRWEGLGASVLQTNNI